MSIQFKTKDFFHPADIFRLSRFLSESQWYSNEKLEAYQLARLKIILKHAYLYVPYYRSLMDQNKIKPYDIRTLDDLRYIPVLKKQQVRNFFYQLKAKNAKKYRPIPCTTSGTTGKALKFYRDKSSDIMEFCYYRRYWSWAGYSLGWPFAEFSAHHFLNTDLKKHYHFQPIINRLLLNPFALSSENIDNFVKAFSRFRVSFLKGSPSTLYSLALLLENKKQPMLKIRAVFSTGELLLPHQRKKIEKILETIIFDSFGHMEMAVAISQCEKGRYHHHSEYGILEVYNSSPHTKDAIKGRIIGTSLHKFAMPFIRYEVGELVEMDNGAEKCECGRSLPVVRQLWGRQQDIIITEDGRFISNLFVYFQLCSGIQWYQFIQEETNRFVLSLVVDSTFKKKDLKAIIRKLKQILGVNAKIEANFLALSPEYEYNKKYRPVVSKIGSQFV